MDWFDQFLLPSIVIAPLIGALFLLFIPIYEPILRKRVAIFVIGIVGFFHARSSFLFFADRPIALDLGMLKPLGIESNLVLRIDEISFIGFSFLLLTIFLLMYCELSKIGKVEFKANSKMLFILSLSSMGLFSENFSLTILIQFIVMQSLFFINLGEGGPHRSSTSLVASIFFTAIDLGAYFAWTWKSDLSFVLSEEYFRAITLLPFAARLLVPFLAPWARLFFSNSSTEVTSLYLCTSFILGASGIAAAPFESPFLFHFSMVAVFFGTLLIFSDRAFSQFHIRLSSVAGALALAMFASDKILYSSTSALIFACTIALVSSFALLMQRAILEDDVSVKGNSLYPLWLAGCALLVIILISGAESIYWKVFLGASALLSISIQLRNALSNRVISTQEEELPYPTSLVFNAWLCFALVLATTVGFQFMLTQGARL